MTSDDVTDEELGSLKLYLFENVDTPKWIDDIVIKLIDAFRAQRATIAAQAEEIDKKNQLITKLMMDINEEPA